jgi:hypothetical protein
MAFNIIAETLKSLDFDLLHKELYQDNFPFDFIPMEGLGLNNGDALGIAIPLKNANINTWRLLKPVLERLQKDFECDVYDLYGGQKLDSTNISLFRNNFIGK